MTHQTHAYYIVNPSPRPLNRGLFTSSHSLTSVITQILPLHLQLLTTDGHLLRNAVEEFTSHSCKSLRTLQSTFYSLRCSDGVYRSTLFIATGFHGLCMIIGSCFLTICFLHELKCHCISDHLFGFEAAA
eukprot:bmy_20928T0